MAWQLLAMNVNGESPILRPPADDQFVSLGTPDEVRRRIDEFFSDTDWSDPTSGHFIAEGQTFTLVFKILDQRPLLALMIDVRGGEGSIPALVGFAKSNGWQLYDRSGGWLDLDQPSADGWRGYNALRHSNGSFDRDEGPA